MKQTNLIIIVSLLLVSVTSCKEEDKHFQTVIIQPGAMDGKDALIWTELPERTDGDTKRFQAMAWTWVQQGFDEGIRRSLIQFKLDDIPAGATIKSAELSLFNYVTPGKVLQDDKHGFVDGNKFYLERVTEAWDEATVTWNNQPSSTSRDAVIVPSTPSERANMEGINVTDLVEYWMGHPNENFGLKLKLVNEYPERSVQFASSDHADSSLHPKLVVKYVMD